MPASTGPSRAIASTPFSGSAPARLDAEALDLEPGEAAVFDRDVEVGTLGQDGGRRAVAGDERLGTEALPLLVGAAGDEQVAAQRRPAAGLAGFGREALGGDDGGGQAGLHVVAAAPVEAAVADLRREQLRRRADRVEVADQHEAGRGLGGVAACGRAGGAGPRCRAGGAGSCLTRLGTPVTGQRGDEVGASAARLPDVDLEAGLGEAPGEAAHERSLARRPRHEAGVGGVDRDQVAEQIVQIGVGGSHRQRLLADRRAQAAPRRRGASSLC